jgi:hypothetical protein
VETFVVRVFTAAFEGGAELIRLLEAKLPTRDRDEAQTKGEAR